MIICLLSIAINVGGVLIINELNVRGKVINKNEFNYLADFSEDLKTKKNIASNTEDFKRVIVNRNKCVEE